MVKQSGPWISLALGVTLIISNLHRLLWGGEGHYWRGGFVSSWISWFLLPIGIIIAILSIRSIMRGEGKPKTYTAEELAQAEAEADALYFREHGEMPQKPPKDEAAPDSQRQSP